MRTVSAGVIAMRNARSTTLRMMLWQCITPFGKPVVPEVSGTKGIVWHLRSGLQERLPANRAGHRTIAEHNDTLQRGQVWIVHHVSAAAEGRQQGPHHAKVVDRAGACRDDECGGI